MVFAHLIFCTDISPGADCASKQRRSCKWEWVKEGRWGTAAAEVVYGGGLLLRNHKHRFIYSPWHIAKLPVCCSLVQSSLVPSSCADRRAECDDNRSAPCLSYSSPCAPFIHVCVASPSVIRYKANCSVKRIPVTRTRTFLRVILLSFHLRHSWHDIFFFFVSACHYSEIEVNLYERQGKKK